MALTEATCRILSMALRANVDPRVLVEQLKGIRCPSTRPARKESGDVNVLSCGDAIARAVEDALESRQVVAPSPPVGACPDCHHRLRREAGCFVCDRCEQSKCG